MNPRVVISCGSGGVGKTTVSAALAIKWAIQGKRVAVLTIDPARRLADSLSIGEIGNTPRRVPLGRVVPDCKGSLDAMVLDAKATFDQLIQRFSPTPDAASRVLDNRYYAFASSRLGGSHEYMAMEKLLELWTDGPYDIIVLDTPPARHALDFLKAPDRMAGLMDQGVMRWLVMPASQGGWRALELGSEALAGVLKRLMGRETVGEIAEFFDAMRGLWDGFRERSGRVNQLLAHEDTRFLLVSAPAPQARADALYFLDILASRSLPFGGLVLNRVLAAPEAPVPELPDDLAGVDGWPAIAEALVALHTQRTQAAEAQQREIARLQRAAPSGARCWTIPDQAHTVDDLESLAQLSRYLPDDIW